MNDFTVFELANLVFPSDEMCKIQKTNKIDVLFKGTCDEAALSSYSDRIVENFSIENDVLVINI